MDEDIALHLHMHLIKYGDIILKDGQLLDPFNQAELEFLQEENNGRRKATTSIRRFGSRSKKNNRNNK